MKESWISKSLVFVIILLFIGVSLAPSINQSVVTASQDGDLVEVTTQACGITGYGDTTVKLTREQYQDLEQYLVEFRARLNQTSTREEAVPLFKEAVLELDKYGLLPKGMSVKRAQKLVLGWSVQQITTGFLNKISEKNQQTPQSNFLCLVAGELNNTYCNRRINNLVYTVAGRIYLSTWNPLMVPIGMIASFRREIFNYFPLAIGDIVGIGYLNRVDHTYYYSSGWFLSFGLAGIKAWNGELVGTLPGLKIWGSVATDGILGFQLYADPGIWGFSGLNVLPGIVEIRNKFYLGSAFIVGISSEPPENNEIINISQESYTI